MKISENNISELLRDGNEKAFAFVYDKYYKVLVAYSYNMVRNQEAANEIVQQIITNIWRLRDNLDISKPILPYLYKSAYNNCNKYIRDNKLTVSSFDEILETQREFQQPDHTNYTDILEEVKLAVNELSEQQQKIFELSRIQGFKNKEVAVKLNITEKTIEYHMKLITNHLTLRLRPKINDT